MLTNPSDFLPPHVPSPRGPWHRVLVLGVRFVPQHPVYISQRPLGSCDSTRPLCTLPKALGDVPPGISGSPTLTYPLPCFLLHFLDPAPEQQASGPHLVCEQNSEGWVRSGPE